MDASSSLYKLFFVFRILCAIITFATVTFVFSGCEKDSDPQPPTAPDSWQQMAEFSGSKRDNGFYFAVNGKGYVGGGFGLGAYQLDFWEYDPTNNVWTQKQEFIGGGRVYSRGFGAGSKGYVTGGFGNNETYGDVWEYDPTTNNWLQKNDFPGGARIFATSFTIDSKAYVGTGADGNNSAIGFNDLWEYDHANDTWTKKADLPGDLRISSFSFAIGSKGYIGGGEARGSGNGGPLKTVYEYNPGLNQWSSKSNSPQEADFGSGNTASFSIGTKGYVVNREGKLWQFDPAANTWSGKADFPSAEHVVGFTLGDYGYVGASYDKYFYRYTPE